MSAPLQVDSQQLSAEEKAALTRALEGGSAAWEAVASLGGSLSVRSQRGVGTCWRAVLPLVSDGLAPAALAAERGPESPPNQFLALGTQS